MKYDKKQVLTSFRKACNSLREAVNERLFDKGRTPYWVVDTVGGVCDFGDTDFLLPEDMYLILAEGVSYEEYAGWRDANIQHHNRIGLYAWLHGCRHVSLNAIGSEEENACAYGEWQSVRSSLPPYDEEVLVCDSYDPFDIRFGHRTNNAAVWRDANDFATIGDRVVSHWMRIKPVQLNLNLGHNGN